MKFRPQLQRTRPDLVKQIDDIVNRTITDTGGEIVKDKSVFQAVFNEKTPGFWLDIFVLAEIIKKNMASSSEFFGYSLIIGRDIQENIMLLGRYLTAHNGIFLSKNVINDFSSYAKIERSSEWLNKGQVHKYGSQDFYRIKELVISGSKEYNADKIASGQFSAFSDAGPKLEIYNKDVFHELLFPQSCDISKKITATLGQYHNRNVLLLEPQCAYMRNSVYQHVKKTNGKFPALTICFGNAGLGSLIDLWSGRIRSLAGGEPTDEIDALWDFLFRGRIRTDASDFILRSIKHFFSLLTNFYISAARKKNHTPYLVLENLNLAGEAETNLIIEILSEMIEKGSSLRIIGITEDLHFQDKLPQWKSVFPVIMKVKNDNRKTPGFIKLPLDLLEIVYSLHLLGRFFPPELFQVLLEEENKNPVMITKAFSLLYSFGVTDNKRIPWPLNSYYIRESLKIPQENINRVKAMVCRRLLSWTEKRNLNPCTALLLTINELGGSSKIDDLLILKSLTSDIINETTRDFIEANNNGKLNSMLSVKQLKGITDIFETSGALHNGDEEQIRRAFENKSTEIYSDLPVLKSQMLVNVSAFQFGLRNLKNTLVNVKEAILLGQRISLPQAYRLFALVYLAKQDTGEANEYMTFALAEAEKTGNYNEMGISAFYAASAQFLFGNIFKASEFAQKSIKMSITAGQADWADRARFLVGRLEFELGRYSKALTIFDDLLREPYDGMKDEKEKMLRAWIYRCNVYLDKPDVLKPEESSGIDAHLFEIEASFFNGDYKKAVELAQKIVNPFTEDKFVYTEQPDWRSGFAQCEHLYYTNGEIHDRMVNVYLSLARSRISKDEGENALHNIQLVLRDERLSEMDPWDAFYFYAWYRILKQTGADLVDMNTAISMAFKRMQRRAGRITDIENRRQYQHGPRWNRELSVTAKEFKLI
jgi:tetratricopeptide (TPR) repeat protein